MKRRSHYSCHARNESRKDKLREEFSSYPSDLPLKLRYMSEWFYVLDGKQQGPVSDEEMSRQLSEGLLSEEVTVWKEGMSDWLPINERHAIIAEAEAEEEEKKPADIPPLEGLSRLQMLSLLACILCLCNPLAAFAFVFSLQAKNAHQDGRIEDAKEKLGKGNRMLIIAFILSLLVYIAIGVYFFLPL